MPKICTQCNKEVPLEGFYRGTGRYGRHPTCKKCYDAKYRTKKKRYPEGCYDPEEFKWFYTSKLRQDNNPIMKEYIVK